MGGKEYMLLVKDDFSRLSAVYFMLSKSEVSKYFKQYLADHRFSGTPSPAETVRTDDAAKFKSGYFAVIFAGNEVFGRSSPQSTAPSLMVWQKGEKPQFKRNVCSLLWASH